mmetsp:Transcript_30914/g.81188  ORF Transcript_30914/g.81188 Transcript_30914/m.81188 type:complete len:538 (-) Transcript_30914:144-1757(-)
MNAFHYLHFYLCLCAHVVALKTSVSDDPPGPHGYAKLLSTTEDGQHHCEQNFAVGPSSLSECKIPVSSDPLDLHQGEVPFCRSECCRRCSTAPGRRLGRFAQWLATEPSEANVFTFGDSTSYYNNFSTSVAFVEAMKRHYPSTKWNFNHGSRESAVNNRELFQAGHFDGGLKDVNVILLQFIGIIDEEFVRLLLNLPGKPLVMAVHHCQFQQLSAHPSMSAERDNKPTAEKAFAKGDRVYLETGKAASRKLIHHYSLPLVSACSAIDQLFSNSCTEEKRINDATELHDAFFYGTDIVHYNNAAMGMEGCLLADLVLQGSSAQQRKEVDDDELPKRLRQADTMTTVFADTTLTGNFHPTMLNGFTRQQGGKGGEKVWYGTTENNASLTFKTGPATELSLMYYKHPDLPMGQVKVFIDGALWTLLDGCCDKACPGIPEHQGFHARTVVATKLPMEPHEVTILTVKRSRKQGNSKCAEQGSKFDVLGVVGKVDESDESLDAPLAVAPAPEPKPMTRKQRWIQAKKKRKQDRHRTAGRPLM